VASFAHVPLAVSCQNTSSALADPTVARLGTLPFVVLGPAHEQSLSENGVMTAAAQQAAAIRAASDVGTQVYFQCSPSKLLPFWEVGQWFAGQEQWLLRDDSGHLVTQQLSPKFHDVRNVTFVDFSQEEAQAAWVAAWYGWFRVLVTRLPLIKYTHKSSTPFPWGLKSFVLRTTALRGSLEIVR
jgi:hypothetical protein